MLDEAFRSLTQEYILLNLLFIVAYNTFIGLWYSGPITVPILNFFLKNIEIREQKGEGWEMGGHGRMIGRGNWD